MNPKKELRTRITPVDVFYAKVRLLEQNYIKDRKRLRTTREMIAELTDDRDLQQLSEVMKELGAQLGQERSDSMWIAVLHQHLPPAIIAKLWREKQNLRQKNDEEPSQEQ